MANRLLLHSVEYGTGLWRYLQHESEPGLQHAYELGRQAIGQGLGVLDMARIHQQAIASSFLPPYGTDPDTRLLKAVETFFMEALSPFEAAHRGFRQANARLRRLNKVLEHRNRELARINRQLETEIRERQRAEQALRKSEDHYRQLFQESCLMQENLRKLSSRILHAQEEERKRISRELHDEVGQALTAISTNLELLQKDAAPAPPQHKRKVAATQTLLRQTMETVHQFARELRPAMLDELGLLPALRSYLKGFAERTGLRVTFQPTLQIEQLGDEQRTVVFRVAQESLNNVAKHARATEVSVTLRRLRHGVRMQVKDNGRAFNVGRHLVVNGRRRLGLLGMQERVRLVDGCFHISSAPGEGTTVSIEIPFRTRPAAAASNRS